MTLTRTLTSAYSASTEFETWRQVALSLWRESRHEDARLLLEDCLKRGEEISTERIVALSNTLAVVQWSEGDHEKALRLLLAAEPLLDSVSVKLQGRAYNNRAILRAELKQYDPAFQDYNLALECHRMAGETAAAHEVENNIATLYVFTGEPSKAHPYLEHLLSECEDNLIVAQAEDTRALALLAEARYREAYDASLHSLNLLKQFPDEEKPFTNSLRTMLEISIRLTTQPTAEQVRDALAATGKSISRAAQLLEMDHSSLAHLIRHKFPELKKLRKDPLQPRGLSKR
jgi:tetratricopeptide (TPR) repeat protein